LKLPHAAPLLAAPLKAAKPHAKALAAPPLVKALAVPRLAKALAAPPPSNRTSRHAQQSV